jgi:uncharacterized iron-regulated protein
MRLLLATNLLLLSAACATSSRIHLTADGSEQSVDDVAAALAGADVVVLGELHDSVAAHQVHQELLWCLHEQRKNLVIAMEMFERDVQQVLLKYLAGLIDEPAFLAAARPPRNYERDYRPVIEFAKANGLVVLAANAPRPLAKKVGEQGIASVAGEPNVARETTAPEDDYWKAFVEAMGDHGGTKGDGAMKRMYEAQCLKDDTMAEAIVDYLGERKKVGDQPLVVLICGRMHSDYRRATVARIQSRMPSLAVRVLTTERVADLGAAGFASPPGVADYVVVVDKSLDAPLPPVAAAEPASKPQPTEAAPQAAAPVAAKPAAPADDAPNPEGLKPALGLMPDYQAQVEGVKVESLRTDGPAEKAGIEAGDIIIELNGVTIDSVSTYAEALAAQKIGKTIPVRVRRGTGEIVYQVEVTSRSR